MDFPNLENIGLWLSVALAICLVIALGIIVKLLSLLTKQPSSIHINNQNNNPDVNIGGNVDGSNINGAPNTEQNIGTTQSISHIETVDKPIFSIPITQISCFTGRRTELEHLKKHLLSKQSKQPVALVGLGGIGKTQTAAQFAYKSKEKYKAIFWVNADSQESLLNSFGRLSYLLTTKQISELDTQIALVQDWLVSHQNWLLILDNVEPDVNWRKIWKSSMQGQVLLTSRNSMIDDGVHPVPLDKMTIKESQKMIVWKVLNKQRLTYVDEQNRSAARELAKLLDGLPLALSQACAYIQQNQCGITGYVELYRTEGYILMRKRGNVPNYDHFDPVATTWNISYEKLAKENPATIELLKICAFLEPDEIPEEIFLQGLIGLTNQAPTFLGKIKHILLILFAWLPFVPQETWKSSLFLLNFIDIDKPDNNDFATQLPSHIKLSKIEKFLLKKISHAKLNGTIELILRYSLLQRDGAKNTLRIHRLVQEDIRYSLLQSDGAKNTLHIYRLVQEYIRSALKFNQQKEVALRTVRLLAATFPYIELSTRPKCERLLASSLQIVDWIKEFQLHTWESAVLLNQLGYYLYEQGQYEQALPLFKQALDIAEKKLGKYHSHTKKYRRNYESCLQKLGLV